MDFRYISRGIKSRLPDTSGVKKYMLISIPGLST